MSEFGSMLNAPEALVLLKLDLQRFGGIDLPDDMLLQSYINAAVRNLDRENVKNDGSADYVSLVVGTASWIYRKRITGLDEPKYVRRMRLNQKYSRRGGAKDA